MNYNANMSARPAGAGPGGRKVKRVSDVQAMGGPTAVASPLGAAAVPPFNPQYIADPFAAPTNFGAGAGGYVQQPPQQQQHQPGYAAGGDYADFSQVPQQQQQQPQHFQQQQQPQFPAPGPPMSGIPGPQQLFNPNAPLGMFQQPIVQDMAMQYGQRLADQGKQLVESQFEKYVPVTRLKYYFAVDNNYVLNKLRLLFFPFTHTNWSLRYDEDNPVQPRYDLNAPDLYIPTMAYITYVVLAGFVLGMQQRFTPEDLGKQSSTALAVLILELLVYTVVLYVTQIPTTLKTLDLLAYAGYKYAAMTVCIVVGILFNGFGYWIALVYCNVALAFFMTRTLYQKLRSGSASATAASDATMQQQQQPPTYDAYGNLMPPPPPQQQHGGHDYNAARTRKLYFTGFLVCLQILVTWWLTRHLIAPSDRPALVL